MLELILQGIPLRPKVADFCLLLLNSTLARRILLLQVIEDPLLIVEDAFQIVTEFFISVPSKRRLCFNYDVNVSKCQCFFNFQIKMCMYFMIFNNKLWSFLPSI